MIDFVDELVEKLLYEQAESIVLADAVPWHPKPTSCRNRAKPPKRSPHYLKQEVGTVKIAVVGDRPQDPRRFERLEESRRSIVRCRQKGKHILRPKEWAEK